MPKRWARRAGSDLLGRSTAFNATLLLTAFFGLVAPIASSFLWLCVSLFFLGSAVGVSTLDHRLPNDTQLFPGFYANRWHVAPGAYAQRKAISCYCFVRFLLFWCSPRSCCGFASRPAELLPSPTSPVRPRPPKQGVEIFIDCSWTHCMCTRLFHRGT